MTQQRAWPAVSDPAWCAVALGERGRNPLRARSTAEGTAALRAVGALPDAEAAVRVHREAHGLVADHIYQVQEGA